MKKSDLKTGMKVVTSEGVYIVMKNTSQGSDYLVCISESGYLNLDGYNDDMKRITILEHKPQFDIIEVYESSDFLTSFNTNKFQCDPIWEREKDIPEYTIDELTEKLGFEFKIKK